MEMFGHEIHELCMLFPFMDDRTLEALIEDMTKHGQRETIKRWRGEIIDGKNRLKVCHIIERQPNIEDLPDDTNILAYIKSTNLCRRDLTPAQRISIAEKLEEYNREFDEDSEKEIKLRKDNKIRVFLEHNEDKRIARAANSRPETVKKFKEIEEKAKEDPIIAKELEKAMTGSTTIEQVHKKMQLKSTKIKKIKDIEPLKEPTKKELQEKLVSYRQEIAYLENKLSLLIEKLKEDSIWEKIRSEIFPIQEIDEIPYPSIKQMREAELI